MSNKINERFHVFLRLFIAFTALAFTPTIFAVDADPNGNKSQGLIVLLPTPSESRGTYPTNDEVDNKIHLPGREYRSGDGWWVLNCGRSCELISSRLSVASKPHPQYDGEPVSGQIMGFNPPLTSSTTALFKPFRSPATQINFRPGPVPTYAHRSNLSRVKRNIKSKGTLEYEMAMADGTTVQFSPFVVLPAKVAGTSEGVDKNIPPTKLAITIAGKRQELGEFNFGISGQTSVKPEEYLVWAGDLDGDGKLDLIIEFDYHGTNRVLFLSTLAKEGELVGRAGSFNYFPIDAAGC
jgi:hypothetical protein